MLAVWHLMTAGAEAADGRAGRWEGGWKKCPGGRGRCHYVNSINSYGTQILTKEERWREIQIQGARRKVAPRVAGEGESRKDPKVGEWHWQARELG